MMVSTVKKKIKQEEGLRRGYHTLNVAFSAVVLLGVTGILLPSHALSAKPRIESKVTVEPKQKLTSSEKASLSRAAGRILLHINDAREAIKKIHKEDPRSHIEKGLILIRIIEESSPYYEVKATITSGSLTYEDVRRRRQLFVPVYEEFG